MLTVNRIALEFFESGIFDKAERFFMYELQIYKKYFTDKNYDLKDYYDMTDIANTLLCLGMLNENKQKIDISLKLYLESFSIYSNESAYSYETYNVSLRISMLYAEHKKFTNALKFLYKSIEYYDIHWGEDENEKKFIDYCNQLDLKHKHQCYYTKEFEYYIKSLELSEELFDEMHMAQLYLKIGDLYTKVPDIAKSIKYYTKALHIREAQLGLEHKDTLVCREKLELLA